MRQSLHIWLGLGIPYLLGMLYLLHSMRYQEATLLAAAPLVALPLYLLVRRFDQLLYFVIFSVPFSLGIKDLGGGLGMSIPSEPLLLLAGLGGLLVLLRQDWGPRALARHPLFWVVVVQHAFDCVWY